MVDVPKIGHAETYNKNQIKRNLIWFLFFFITRKFLHTIQKGVLFMKGYNTEDGYMGFVDGEYQFFASEADYRNWVEE